MSVSAASDVAAAAVAAAAAAAAAAAFFSLCFLFFFWFLVMNLMNGGFGSEGLRAGGREEEVVARSEAGMEVKYVVFQA